MTSKLGLSLFVIFSVKPYTYTMVDNVIFKNLLWFWNFTLFEDKSLGVNLTVGNLFVAIFFVVIGKKVASRVSVMLKEKALTRFVKDKNSLVIYENLSFYLVFFFFFLIALKIAHIPLTIFTLVGGALAIGIGFGSQNLVNNFISGIIMMIEEPIKIGDFIEVDGLTGRVEEIGARSTKIISLENKHYIVPNSAFLEKNVLNWTLNNDSVRSEVSVGVAYGTDTRKVEELLLKAAKDFGMAMNHPAPYVLFDEFGDNALNFKIKYWTNLNKARSIEISNSAMRFKIDALFKEAGIVIAFPQRDIHLDTLTPLEIKLQKS